jgi:FPC/CPF motif-containing protein YcgG
VRDSMNPFHDPVALANSSYSLFDGRRLVRADGTAASPLMKLVHDGVRALVLNDQFPCVGGKSALRHGTYRFGLYSELACDASAAGLAHDLFAFSTELPSLGDAFTTFIASFGGPHPADEITFERDLWKTLQTLHDLDTGHHRWDPGVSDDPADPRFSFSFAGVAFFVIGLHAGSSRAARRFAWPTLVFNPHRQFERLRDDGEYARFQRVIRRSETSLQGDVNPMVADFGTRSEAMQYSGRQVDERWVCPFHAHAHDDPPAD